MRWPRPVLGRPFDQRSSKCYVYSMQPIMSPDVHGTIGSPLIPRIRPSLNLVAEARAVVAALLVVDARILGRGPVHQSRSGPST